jgi:xanthine dehydrogenase accessory factor
MSDVAEASFTDVAEAIEVWRRDGHRVALATVVDTKRSAPQPIGTKMAVQDGGQVVGAVSGGCVEGAVVEIAEEVLAGAEPSLTQYGIADEEAWDVGLPCGGEISIWVESYATESLQRSFTERARAGARAAIVTALQGTPSPGAKLLVEVDQAPRGTLGEAQLDAAALALAEEAMWSEQRGLHEHAGALLFVDVAAPPARLVIVGAVDFAAQLSALAKLSGWRAFVIDPRSRFATPERFPAAERVIAAWPEQAFSELQAIDRATAIAVLTHDPKLDDAALTAALQSPAGYIGAMGSRRAQARRRERLLAAGLQAVELDRIAAPIGLDLGAASAAETALSIMGEIIAVRNGRDGGRLADRHGSIHGEVAASAG